MPLAEGILSLTPTSGGEDDPLRLLFRLECEEDLAETVFFNTAELLDLSVDIVFFDGSSTYW